MVRQIKNIIFDMGNVLTKYTLHDYIRSCAKTEEEFKILKYQVCGSVEWICMDRGTMTVNEAVASICKRIPAPMHQLAERFILEFRGKPEPNPPMECLLGDLKTAGYRLYLMSNVSPRFRQFCGNLPSVSMMDGIWISCERGFLKPEQEAYLDFFDYMGVNPAECFFIDDSAANIEAAMRLGMRGCVYHQDLQELRENLQAVI